MTAYRAGVAIVDILDGADGSAGALKSSMNLAATEGMDLAFAGEIMAQAMNAYGIEAKDSAKITDILAAGAIASTASVEGLASGLKYTSANAAALGQPLDDTVTALALLNNVGLTASTAGTSFNQMLTGLSSPTKQASDLMMELGFSATDAFAGTLTLRERLKPGSERSAQKISFRMRRSSTRGTPRGLLGGSGSITRHSKSADHIGSCRR